MTGYTKSERALVRAVIDIAFDIGQHKNHAQGLQHVVGTFDDLACAVLATADHTLKDGPYIAGPFLGAHRKDENAQPRAWVALDLDKIGDEVEMAAIVEAAEAWRGIGYTTHSHDPQAGKFKMRVIFAADREVTPAEYPRLCAGLAAALAQAAGVPVERDTACDKIEQALYTVRAGATTWHFDGAPVAVDQTMAPEQAERQPRKNAGAKPGHADWLKLLLEGDDIHANALRLVGHLVATGVNDKTIRAAMQALAIGVAQARGADRAADLVGPELDRMLKGARGKGFAPPPIPEIEPECAEPGYEDEAPPAPHPARVSLAPMESDIWLAALFAKRFTSTFRWSPGLEWMSKAGTHWVRDDGLLRYSKAKLLCADVSRAKNIEPSTRRAIASSKTVNAVLTLARAEPGISTPADAWDRDPMVLNTPGGAYDLETGKRLVVSTGLHTQITAAAPDASMATPNWLRFVSEIFANDLEKVEFIQRLFGYCLTGDRREQKLPFFYGTGANGKSVLIDETHAVMGTYALNLPSEALMRQQHVAHPTELAQLRGKRLAISSELEDGAYWAESRIKSLTGDATLTARFMRQDFFEFRQTQKHIVVGNFKPRLKGDDPAIARRMVLVPFTEKFTGHRCDPVLPEKLARERPGILAWMIEGARKWARDGLLIPATVRDASAEYLSAHDDIALWVDDCCRTGPMLKATSAVLYKSFSDWKIAAGERPQAMNAWSSRMAQRFTPARTLSARGFEGVDLGAVHANVYGQAKRA